MHITSTYRETYCAFCQRTIYQSNRRIPSWLAEWIGHTLWRFHRHTVEHQVNRGLSEDWS
jgi:hypothetical protein